MEFAELERLINSYWPNEEVLRDIGRIELLGTVGPSAVGKSSVTLRAIEKMPAIHPVLSDVNRPPRPHEKDSVNYYFRSQDAMLKDLVDGNFVQIRIPSATGNLYATRPESYPKDGIGTLAIITSAIETFRRLPFKEQRYAFVVPSSYSRWQEWFAEQSESSRWSVVERSHRQEEAARSLEFALDARNSFLTFVLNDDIESASDRLIQVAKGQLPDDHAKARKLAEENYQKLKAELR